MSCCRDQDVSPAAVVGKITDRFLKPDGYSEAYMEENRKKRTDLGSTQFFRVQPEQANGVQKILSVVYEALSEKGYDPVNQIVGYIMSGDPTYVTNYKGARSLIMKVERDELVEEIMRSYIRSNHWSD